MGGRGTFSIGKGVPFAYKTVDKIYKTKILQPMDDSKSYKLPEESHSSSSYVLLDKTGVFHQYRKYNKDHKVVLEIGYHVEASLGKGKILHVHIHNKPGVDYHNQAKKEKIYPGHPIYERYKKYFKGVDKNER